LGIISSIKLQGCPVFTGIDSSLDECAIVNFIYGSNGSGKSTISNYLRDPQMPCYSACSIEWTGSQSEILVYNKEWRETNFRSRDDLPGVFTLGSDTVEARESIQKLHESLSASEEKLQAAEANKTEKENELAKEIDRFQKVAWDGILKPNERYFAPALSGFRNSKSKFAEGLLGNLDAELSITREALVSRVQSVFNDDPIILGEIDDGEIAEIISSLKSIESDPIWGKVIVGNNDINISGLIEELKNSDWVNRGRSYIRESGICPFCQKRTIDEDFKKQIDLYFDAQYEKDIADVTSKIHEYERRANLLEQNLDAIVSDEKYSCFCGDGLRDLSEVLLEFERITSSNLGMMKQKSEESSRVIKISENDFGDKTQIIIASINAKIREHNEMIANRNEEKKALSKMVWALLVSENNATIQAFNRKVKNLESAIRGLTKTAQNQQVIIQQLTNEIIEVRKTITSIQPTIDEINRSLNAYGFDGFSIQPSVDGENNYQIVRPDGTPAARTLSEGEETFIAFLYFMQLVQGTTNPNSFSSEKVLVIDDPICSLDSTILYIVSCLIKNRIREAKDDVGGVKQVFILTHNAFFHKEASFNRGQSFRDGKTKYWMIRKYGGESKIRCFGQDNPIKTSYELLWDEVKDESTTVVSLQNAMRRIIENYFGMLGSHKDETIEEQFETVEERMICRSLFSWMNDGSHSIPDDLYIDSYSESPDKYRAVFKDVFEKTNHLEHYKMMMGE